MVGKSCESIDAQISSEVLANISTFYEHNSMNSTSGGVWVGTKSAACNYVPSFSCSLTCENKLSTSELEINQLTSSTNFSLSSFSSSSAATSKKPPHCVSLKKYSLTRRGYKSFQDWNTDPNHVYIGRDMSHHVAGALGSKWGNPFKAKKSDKNS